MPTVATSASRNTDGAWEKNRINMIVASFHFEIVSLVLRVRARFVAAMAFFSPVLLTLPDEINCFAQFQNSFSLTK